MNQTAESPLSVVPNDPDGELEREDTEKFNELFIAHLRDRLGGVGTKVVFGSPLLARIDPSDEDPEETLDVSFSLTPVAVKTPVDEDEAASPPEEREYVLREVLDCAARKQAADAAWMISLRAGPSTSGAPEAPPRRISMRPVEKIRCAVTRDADYLTWHLTFEWPGEVEIVRAREPRVKKVSWW